MQAESLLAVQSEKPVRLLVVDSIAAPFRDVGDNPGVQQYAQRSNLFFQVLLPLSKSSHHNETSDCCGTCRQLAAA